MRFTVLHIFTIIVAAAGAFLSAEAVVNLRGDGAPGWLSGLWALAAVSFVATCALLVMRSARACQLALLALALLVAALGIGAFDLLAALRGGGETGLPPSLLLALLPLGLPAAFWAYVTRDIFRLRRRGELS
ncbi:MAG: hypothetical protein MUE79_05565 [Nitratireductor sp.]|jgi:hypothetical protein|nr:hypothetical protein [Nitratireductor sp.]